MFQVKDVARQLNLNPQTLYFYERIGLIPPPPRNQAGYRLFSSQDVERLAFIGRAKALGLTLEEIKDILTLKEQQSLTCKALYDRLVAKLQHLEAQIQQLQQLRAELVPLVEKCHVRLAATDRDRPCTVLDEARSTGASQER